jgi:hypothetical protein
MMPCVDDLETDSNGDIITNPVIGWTTATLAGMSVFLAIHYVETPLELETEDGKSIQMILTPQQCLELAERLTNWH